MEAAFLLRGAVHIAKDLHGRRKKACRAETIVHLFKICSARQYVVASVKRIETETIASVELHPGTGHELHQSHSSFVRPGTFIAATLGLHDRANPALRNGKATSAFRDEGGKNRLAG